MLYQIMFYGGLSLAVISIVLAVVVFFKHNIRKVSGDVTDINAPKAIKKLREEGAEEDPKKNKIKDSTTRLLSRSHDSFTDRLASFRNNKKNDASKNNKRVEEDNKDVSKLKNAREKAAEQFVGNGVYRQTDRTSKQTSNAGFTVIEEATSLLAEEIGTNVLVSDLENKDLIQTKNITSVLIEDEVTSILAEDEETSVLMNDEITSVLTRDEDTSILVEDEITSVLAGEETSILAEDEITSVLVGEETSVLVEDEITSVLVREETSVLVNEEVEEITEILRPKTDNSDVFTQVEDMMIHHSKERLN